MQRDAIDFEKENTGVLFRRMLIPTLISSVFSMVMTISDGIFVGHGIGSSALAAVNIVAPLWLIGSGIGLMFGMGASVVASIHLAKNKLKAARINLTQSILFSSLLLAVIAVVVCIFRNEVLSLLGCPDDLKSLAILYMSGFIPFLPFNALLLSGTFFIRLDGSPRYAMACTTISAILNLILDYLFIFVFRWGILGAAIATSLGSLVGAAMIIGYLSNGKHKLRFIKIKASRKSMKLTSRNLKYMMHIGLSGLLADASISFMMLCGNYVFGILGGDDLIAAFSVVCYFFPIVFMIYEAVGMSVQPIISYNHAKSREDKKLKALRLAVFTNLGIGIPVCLLAFFFPGIIASLFLPVGTQAYLYTMEGLPLFSLGFIFYAGNMIAIIYYQSIEKANSATTITIMRGFVFMAIAFTLLSYLFGIRGAWLAVPSTEVLTLLLVLLIPLFGKKSAKNKR